MWKGWTKRKRCYLQQFFKRRKVYWAQGHTAISEGICRNKFSHITQQVAQNLSPELKLAKSSSANFPTLVHSRPKLSHLIKHYFRFGGNCFLTSYIVFGFGVTLGLHKPQNWSLWKWYHIRTLFMVSVFISHDYLTHTTGTRDKKEFAMYLLEALRSTYRGKWGILQIHNFLLAWRWLWLPHHWHQ